MVATKRVPLAEVDNGKERRSGNNDGGRGFEEPLGGFIFVCNNDTIGEDFDRHLFGLPQKYQESVKAIQPGLPLFLYNYSTRCLHGVFEASSDGGLNIEPDAWGENKDARKNGRQSRFPAQVRVRWREERPPLEEVKFRPVLYHYDGPKFRLQLSKSEAHELLKLFGASSARKIEEVQEDAGGEWEEVKTKSKASRSFRASLAKGSTSPNSTAGRRWGSTLNGSSSNGGAPLSSLNNSVHEAVSRARDRESKIDSAQRWRTDSDSWSGSSSAGTSSNCGSQEEDRSKKGIRENGCSSEIIEGSGLVFGQGHDGIDGITSSKGVIHLNGSIDPDHKVEIRHSEDDSNELNVLNSNSLGPSGRSGFVSYSAALKSGMLALGAAENGLAENHVPSLTESATSPNSSLGNRSRNSYSSVANVMNGPPASPSGPSKADAGGDKIDGPKQKLEVGFNKVRNHGEGLIVNHVKVGPQVSLENGKQEHKIDQSNGDGDSKRTQPWGKLLAPKATPSELAGGQGVQVADSIKSTVKSGFDPSTLSKKVAKDALRNTVNEGETGDGTSELGQCNTEIKENSLKPLESTVRRNAWQGNDGAVLRLLHDPDPAVNSTAMNGSNTGHRVESEVYKKQEKVAPVQLQPAVQFPVEKIMFLQPSPLDACQSEVSKQLPSTSGAPLAQGSHPKTTLQEAPALQQTKSVYEPRRQQFDHQKHERHQDDKPQFRKQHAHPPDSSQPSSPMLHSQVGPGLLPLRIPTPPLPGMQQHHHHPLLSSAPQGPLYRERSRSRGGNGSVENVHGFAYRPISRNMLDGEVALQNQLVPGSWGSPVLLMQPVISPVTGNMTLPPPAPHMLGNVEALHAEILEFAQTARPSAETRVHAEAAVEYVRSCVKELWPEADVEVFGSFATGLCLHHSDVDVVVVDVPPPPEISASTALSGARLLIPLIRDLSAALKEFEWCEVLNTIETASMPVIKLRCNPVIEGQAPGPPVAIDVTIGGKRSETFAGVAQASSGKQGGNKPVNPKFEAARNAHNGAAAREFVIERLRQLPALAPLVLLLKSFLRSRGLNDVYSGGLGSFALTLMLVFYLERVPISCGTPQEPSRPFKPPSNNMETSRSSVDISQAPAAAESVDFSDDESTDSSVLTSTSASSVASMDVQSAQGSTSGGDHASTQGGFSNGEPLLRKAGGIVEELLSSMHSVASPNLGTLLVGFLHFFGQEIDFSRVRLVLKGKNGSAGGVFWHEKNARTLPLWIDDPLRPDANIGAGSFNIWQVQAAMREMLSVIMRPQPVMSNPLPESGRTGKGLGRRRHLPLLQQFFANDPSP